MSGLFSKFATVGGASMTSRLLGFVREALLAATLGTGPVADVF
jgi:putative peptidoglycan lipid II flippase